MLIGGQTVLLWGSQASITDSARSGRLLLESAASGYTGLDALRPKAHERRLVLQCRHPLTHFIKGSFRKYLARL